MAPKNQPRQKTLQAWVRFGLRHLFDADLLDPRNAPALARDLDLVRAQFVNWANDPEGLEKQFNELVQELREQFAERSPHVRLRYATVLPPPPSEN